LGRSRFKARQGEKLAWLILTKKLDMGGINRRVFIQLHSG
jgi:hypothetical protein